MAGEDHPAHRLEDGNPGEVLGALPAIQGERQGPAHAHVVEGLSLVVRRGEKHAVPVALLHGDVLAERGDEVVASLGREAAELDRRPVAADRLHAQAFLLGEDRLEAVEVGLAGVVVVGVALALDEGAGLPLLEDERAGAQHVLLVPVLVGVELRLLVDEVVGRGQRWDEGARRVLELEHHRLAVRGGNALHHVELGHAGARDALRREDDPLKGGVHVLRQSGPCRRGTSRPCGS